MIALIFALLFCSNSTKGMEKDKLAIYLPFKIEATQRLSKEDLDTLAPDYYPSHKEEGRIALGKLAEKMIELKNKSLQTTTASSEEVNALTQCLINLREAVLSKDKPIEVTNEFMARARAAQRLMPEQQLLMNRKGYLANEDEAKKVINIFATYAAEEMEKHNLLPHGITAEEYKNQTIQKA